jgi:hypothetical protein
MVGARPNRKVAGELGVHCRQKYADECCEVGNFASRSKTVPAVTRSDAVDMRLRRIRFVGIVGLPYRNLPVITKFDLVPAKGAIEDTFRRRMREQLADRRLVAQVRAIRDIVVLDLARGVMAVRPIGVDGMCRGSDEVVRYSRWKQCPAISAEMLEPSFHDCQRVSVETRPRRGVVVCIVAPDNHPAGIPSDRRHGRVPMATIANAQPPGAPFDE